MKTYQAIRIEGGLFGPDLLDQLAAGELPGQRPGDFGLGSRANLTEEISAVFREAARFWATFRERLERLDENDPGTTTTRDLWIIPLLNLLGYDLHYNHRAYEVDGLTFAISHRAGVPPDAPPVHIVGARQSLDRVSHTGRPRMAPHSLLQEFLNRTERLWGIVTNGLTLRLLRDCSYIRRQAYIEFDLNAIFESQLFPDFALLYRLLHRSRLPRTTADNETCLLERYHKLATEQGDRLRDQLRDSVELFIKTIANGFLAHPANQQLRTRLARACGPGAHTDTGCGNPAEAAQQCQPLTPEEFYRHLLRLAYRFLFLLVSEERGLISANPLYLEHYSVTRLRKLVHVRAAYNEHDDLWHGLRVLWAVFANPDWARVLDVAPLNGELFNEIPLDHCSLANRHLLEAFAHLSEYYDQRTHARRRVNYAALNVEELGSVYESLLDFHPQVDWSGPAPRFEFAPGSERKSTGSYYTPPTLVAELIRTALEPVLAQRLKAARTPEEKERAILSLRVCDPACGSGHFLLAAARHLGRELARIRSGQDEPPPDIEREAIRDVITHCIYGVDKNPLAVELCRVALWLEAHCHGKPLTFLDHRIRCGDSLVGVFDLAVLPSGIPDEAFKPLTNDDKHTAQYARRRNEAERRDTLFQHSFLEEHLKRFASEFSRLNDLPETTIDQVHAKAEAYHRLARSPELQKLRLACDVWTAAFFQPFGAEPKRGQAPALQTPQRTPQAVDSAPGLECASSAGALGRADTKAAASCRTPNAIAPAGAGWPALSEPITTDALRTALSAGRLHDARQAAWVQTTAQRLRFLHWPLEFPEVFAAGGFDVVLGNPPWERIKLQEQEFFATRDPQIAAAPNKAARQSMIDALPKTNPALAAEFARAKHEHEAASKFVRASDRFPLTSRGDINTYALFAELARRLLAPGGRAGIIVPTGIATDDTCKTFFADLNQSRALISLFDFENRERIFPAVDSRLKFCLLTMRGRGDHRPEREQAPALQTLPRSHSTSNPAQRIECADSAGTLGRADTKAAASCRTPNAIAPSSATAEFTFFLTRTEQLRDPRRRFSLQPEDLALLNPNTRTCPVFRTRVDADLTRAIYRRLSVLVNETTGQNLWAVSFLRMIDMANDSHLFRTREQLEQDGFTLHGNVFVKGDPHSADAIRYLPLYEAKMVWQFDHRWATYENGETRDCTDAEKQDPHFTVQPRYWVAEAEVEARLGDWKRRWLLGFRRITNATNERTMVSCLFPRTAGGDVLPVCYGSYTAAQVCCVLGDFNSLPFDYTARQKVGGTHMDFHYLKQIPALPPSAYSEADLAFIVPRVLELVYTAWDLQPFAAEVWEGDRGTANAAGQGPNTEWQKRLRQLLLQQWEANHGRPAPVGIDHAPFALPPFRWDDTRRAVLRAELDAYFARLYGLTRKQLRYILDPADLTARELENILDPWEEVTEPLDPAGYAARCAASDFPGETFRVLKEKELDRWGEYRTRRLVLEAWERLRSSPAR